MPKRKPLVPLNAGYIEVLHDLGIAITWPGIEPVGAREVLDYNLLESAPRQPFQAAFGVEFYPTIHDKAACLFFSICAGHIFSNGNKRTAVLALDQFLLANEVFLLISNQDMRPLAEETAQYNLLGQNQQDVKCRLATTIRENSITFRELYRTNPKLNHTLHRTKRKVRAAIASVARLPSD